MHILSKLSFLTIAAVVVGMAGVAVVAAAPNSHVNAAASSQTTGQPTDPGSQGSSHQPSDPSSQGATKLAAAQLKSCQNRQTAINNILSRIVTRGQNQLTLFNTIAQRVETFATSKNVTVSNYAQLVATLQADRTKATNDLAAMKTSDTLDCSSTNPKGMVSAFQADLKQEISDLQTYKTDVKNLIVAVKTAVGSSTSSSNTNSTTTTGGNQ